MTISYKGFYAVSQEDGDGGIEWHVYKNSDPNSYMYTVSNSVIMKYLKEIRQ